MTVNTPRGLREHRHLGGAVCPATRRYRVKANGASGGGQKFAGDPVHLVSGNTVSKMTTTASGASGASLPLLGVIRAVYNSNGRPFTHSAPTGGSFIPASTAGFVEVNIDPNQTYVVSMNTTANSTHIGQYVELTAAAANTAAGRSGFMVELSAASNTAARTRPLQVIAITSHTEADPAIGAHEQDLEVIIADHAFRPVVQAPTKVR